MPTESRYLLKPTQTINGLTAKQLSILTQSGFYESISQAKGSAASTIYMGIRVWKRSSGGAETEITAGTPVAQVSRTAAGGPTPPLSNTWACPLTSLVSTDSIVVRWYTKFDADAWILLQTCTTEQLNAQSLDAATWSVLYYFQAANMSTNALSTLYYDGDFETLDYYPTWIDNFIYTLAPPPPVAGKEPFHLKIHGITIYIS